MPPVHRRGRPLERETRPVRDARLFVIAVEGARTEHHYFCDFRSTRLRCEVISPEENKSSPKHVLQRLEDYQKEYQLDTDEDFLWLVCDRDRWTAAEMTNVAQQCIQKGYGLAVSNPCFECWLVLHFRDLEAPASSRELTAILKKELGGYRKSRYPMAPFRPRIDQAIARAQKLDAETEVSQRWPERNPGTHVYKLAQAIRKFMGQNFWKAHISRQDHSV